MVVGLVLFRAGLSTGSSLLLRVVFYLFLTTWIGVPFMPSSARFMGPVYAWKSPLDYGFLWMNLRLPTAPVPERWRVFGVNYFFPLTTIILPVFWFFGGNGGRA